MAAALISGALGVGSSLLGGISSTILGSQHLQLQKEQLKLSQQALEQNRDLSEKSLRLQAVMPFLTSKANAQAVKDQMKARYEFYQEAGADPISLMALSQGKTVFASGGEHIATTRDTHISNISNLPGTTSSTPIILDLTPKKKPTANKGSQAGRPSFGEVPGRATQTTGQTSDASTQVGFQFVFNNTRSRQEQREATQSYFVGVGLNGARKKFPGSGVGH